MAGRYTPRTIGSKPTPRDEKTEEVRDSTSKGNPYGKKYGSTGTEKR